MKLFLALVVACAVWSAGRAAGAALVIDDFNYSSSGSAQAAWVNTSGPAVTMATGGDWGTDQVMVATCDFATRASRCYWDRTVSLNLAAYVQFELEVYAPNPGAISALTLYFHSGSGWYGASVTLTQTGWQTLRFAASDFVTEGTPSGWNQINGIRLSPWKAASQNTYLAVRQLRAVTPSVLLVRDTQSSDPNTVQDTINRHLTWLGSYNVDCGVITRTNVEAGLLQQSRVAILPFNESVSEAEMTNYESFVAGGGKLMVYYLLPGRLPALLGVKPLGWTAGNFGAWVFCDPVITNLPARVEQASWNITIAGTNGTLNGRVTAQWEDSQGQDTGKAAWLGSDHGFFMSHVLLGDDADNKAYALLCLVGSLLPEVWPPAAAGAIGQMGDVGPYLTYTDAAAGIRGQGAVTLRANLVESELAAAETNRLAALGYQAAGQYSAAIVLAQSARAHLRQAYSYSLRPVYPEFRGIWEGDATGPYPGDWASGAASVATNQFTAVFPNMLSGGVAHYNSAYLPHSDSYNLYGDQISACVSAAHARGLQVHVWTINWNLTGAPQTFIDSLRAAGRTQVSSAGAATDWLCPSHPDNFALETNVMLEVVRNYDVDGIHFDYIRYPDADHCYCSGCSNRFVSQTGLTVTNWPADVLAAGTLRNAFLDWRRAQITRLVQTVYAQVKAVKPAVKVSAAVFADAVSAYDGVGQDWRLWITNGILDFVCPMDYTAAAGTFTNYVTSQLGYVGGRAPVYPGIGAYLLETDGALAQVEATRAANTRGFVIFELSAASATSLLPAMGAGATAPDEPDSDNDGLPDSWEQRWFGNLATPGIGTDFDHDGMSDWAEYVAGTDPTQASSVLTLGGRGNGGVVEVSFEARGVDAPGYQNAARHYRLESTGSLGPGATWAAMAGYEDWAAGPGVLTVTCTVSPAGTSRFYRLRVWLQEKQ